jgi:hypothetical protein
MATSIDSVTTVSINVEIEKYAGSGFAGQVYRVRAKPGAGVDRLGLSPDLHYGLKIYRPVSRFSSAFRDLLFRLGFGFPYAPRCYEAACRSNALWQKLLRHAARSKLGTEECISDVYATVYDPRLYAFGAIKEWVEGRPWKLEIDDRVLNRPKPARPPHYREPSRFRSEYIAKRFFMARLVRLLHEAGAPDLARQFEWSTWKSQPNVLKRFGHDGESYVGLTAIDFQAGLVLLPFLPMSPGDFRLIGRGLRQGRFVQFDQSDMRAQARFVDGLENVQDELEAMLENLRTSDEDYRLALPDLTNFRLPSVWRADRRRRIAQAYRDTWVSRGYVTKDRIRRLERAWPWWFFFLAGAVPFLGGVFRRRWGVPEYALHLRLLWRPAYFGKWLTSLRYQALIRWYHSSRGSEAHLTWLADRPWPFILERIFLSWIPLWWFHRAVVDGRWAMGRIVYGITRPFKLYFSREIREAWLLQHLVEGMQEGMVTDTEAEEIRRNISDPFIQQYLKCLAVHLCTLPITQLAAVALGAGIAYYRGWSFDEGMLMVAGLLAAFAVTPVSPGSIVRGLYVVYVAIRQREWRRYRIALVLSFWKYIGYLAFPIQMVTTYRTLSRFMASRWATDFVSIIPVFGEPGALLQHRAFDLLYNLPISYRRRRREKREKKRQRKALRAKQRQS